MKFCPECGNPVEGYKKLLKIQEVKRTQRHPNYWGSRGFV